MLWFEWDPAKAEANRRKQKVSFEEARSVFADEHARLIDDPDHSSEEDRFVLLGLSAQVRVFVIVHCYRSSDSVVRVISARRASKAEERSYPG